MIPLVKTAEQPTFVSNTNEMTDPNKPYVLSTDGYFYAYRENENYNLLKTSEQLGYYGINVIDDDYFNRVRNALPELMSKISANFNVDYNLDTPDTCFGFLTTSTGSGILRTWICDNKIAGVLIEGFAGFVGKKAVTAEVFKANEEQMVNWLITASYYLSQ